VDLLSLTMKFDVFFDYRSRGEEAAVLVRLARPGAERRSQAAERVTVSARQG
jgi:hypothetical protein